MAKPDRVYAFTASSVSFHNQHHLPIQTPGGAVVAVLLDKATKTAVEIWRDANPQNLNFSLLATTDMPASVGSMSVAYRNDRVHVLCQLTDRQVRYSRYNLASNTWEIEAALVASATPSLWVGCDIAVTDDGLIHAAYQGPRSGFLERVYYSNSADGNSWSAGVELDGGDPTKRYRGPRLVAAGNRLHAAYFSHSDGLLLTRTRNSGGSWSIERATGRAVDIGAATIGKGLTYTRAGSTRVAFPFMGYPANQGGFTLEFASSDDSTTFTFDNIAAEVDSVPALALINGQLHCVTTSFGETQRFTKLTAVDGWSLAGTLSSNQRTEVSAAVMSRNNGDYLATLFYDYDGVTRWSEIKL